MCGSIKYFFDLQNVQNAVTYLQCIKLYKTAWKYLMKHSAHRVKLWWKSSRSMKIANVFSPWQLCRPDVLWQQSACVLQWADITHQWLGAGGGQHHVYVIRWWHHGQHDGSQQWLLTVGGCKSKGTAKKSQNVYTWWYYKNVKTLKCGILKIKLLICTVDNQAVIPHP